MPAAACHWRKLQNYNFIIVGNYNILLTLFLYFVNINIGGPGVRKAPPEAGTHGEPTP